MLGTFVWACDVSYTDERKKADGMVCFGSLEELVSQYEQEATAAASSSASASAAGASAETKLENEKAGTD